MIQFASFSRSFPFFGVVCIFMAPVSLFFHAFPFRCFSVSLLFLSFSLIRWMHWLIDRLHLFHPLPSNPIGGRAAARVVGNKRKQDILEPLIAYPRGKRNRQNTRTEPYLPYSTGSRAWRVKPCECTFQNAFCFLLRTWLNLWRNIRETVVRWKSSRCAAVTLITRTQRSHNASSI